MAAAVQPAPVTPPAVEAQWNPVTRVAFRFAFCYLGLYCLIALGNMREPSLYEPLWSSIVPWVGQHIFRLSKPITYFVSGSGDKTSDYVLLFCHLVIAIAATVVWSIFDRRREYTRLNQWLRVAIRYALVANMLAYGAFKVIKLQFPDPQLTQLAEPVRDLSPMGLLWLFMEYSAPYTFFAGACELLGGVLLFFRRTAALGALVTAAVMINVTMLNYSYDVGVKLLSTHLVLMCGYLLLPEFRSLFDFFVSHRPAALLPAPAVYSGKRWRIAQVVAKVLFIVVVVVVIGQQVVEAYPVVGPGAPKSPVYGIWDVEEFTRDGVTLPPLLTDTDRWRWFLSERTNAFAIRGMNDRQHAYFVRFDMAKSTIFSDRPQVSLELHWSRPDASHLVLSGTMAGHAVSARMKKVDSRLLTRGFHWINELPYNR